MLRRIFTLTVSRPDSPVHCPSAGRETPLVVDPGDYASSPTFLSKERGLLQSPNCEYRLASAKTGWHFWKRPRSRFRANSF